MPDRGVFLTFEGPEGAGKSTQIQRLAEHLRAAGRTVHLTREPGGTAASDRIRDVLLDPDLTIEPVAEFLLYAAARAQHVRETILPALEAGHDVVCDRFAASSVAYQGYGRGLDLAWVDEVNTVATDGLRPDATFLLDLPSDVGLERIASRGAPDRLEQADAAFHRRVRDGYLEIARGQPHWVVVDATADAEAVAERIWRAARAVLDGRDHVPEPAAGSDEPA